MKRVFRTFLIFLLVTSFFNLFACFNDISNKDIANNQTPDISIKGEINPDEEIKFEEKNPTVIRLTKHNYSSYLNISINQTAQSSTLISNNYYVTYRYGNSRRYEYYTGLTPPSTNDVLNCTYISSKYSVSTTFTINCRSRDEDYMFSNCQLTITEAKASHSRAFVTVYISQDGNGSGILMMVEELSKPNKSYSPWAAMEITDFKGEVSLFNSN